MERIKKMAPRKNRKNKKSKQQRMDERAYSCRLQARVIPTSRDYEPPRRVGK